MEKILIHALGASMGGAMRHLTNFLPELGRQDANREYVVLVRESFPVLDVAENIRFERIPDQECSSWIKRILSDVFELPRKLKRENFSAIVSLTNFGPIWSPVPHIFFQRNALYYCPYYLEKIGGQLKVETLLRRRLAVASMMRADLIVTPSHAMGEMIREVCPETRSRTFKTLYHGFDANISWSEVESVMPPAATDAWPVLFFPSHLGEYKGYRLLFETVNLLKHRFPKLKLLLTFSKKDAPNLFVSYQHYLQQLGITQHVLMIGKVPQDAIWGLYKKSDLMVYPSLCESFGFSMLEAMGENLPIVAADTGINREICGTAARYFSPLSAKNCAEHIAALLDDDVTRNALRSEGARRVAEFDWSWRRYVAEFTTILEDLKL